MHANIARAPVWAYDCVDRLSHLAGRARELADSLRRERCDSIGDRAAVALIDARIALLETRFRRFADSGRRLRRLTKICA